jgi:type IV pilus assembly protein PilQ
MFVVFLLFFLFPQSPQDLRVSFDLKDADLESFLVTMGQAANLNVVLHPEVKGKITLSVRDASWQNLLDVVLNNYQLQREIQGNVLRIAPVSAFAEEFRQRAAVNQACLDAVPLETHIYTLNYAKAADVMREVSALLSPRGSIVVDTRQNALIVRDVPADACKGGL